MCGPVVLWFIGLGVAESLDAGSLYVYGTLAIGVVWLVHQFESDDSGSGHHRDTGSGGGSSYTSSGRSGFGGDGDSGDGSGGGGDGGGGDGGGDGGGGV